jgi:hypothetical protein
VQFDDAVLLAPEGAGTRLRATLTARLQGFMRLMEPVMGRIMRQQFERNWTALKRALEEKDTVTST